MFIDHAIVCCLACVCVSYLQGSVQVHQHSQLWVQSSASVNSSSQDTAPQFAGSSPAISKPSAGGNLGNTGSGAGGSSKAANAFAMDTAAQLLDLHVRLEWQANRSIVLMHNGVIVATF